MNHGLWLATLALTATTSAASQQPVYDDPQLDDQPAIIASTSREMFIVFERLQMPGLKGDLFATRSTDGGMTWSTPVSAIETTASERAPSLVRSPDGTFTKRERDKLYLRD